MPAGQFPKSARNDELIPDLNPVPILRPVDMNDPASAERSHDTMGNFLH